MKGALRDTAILCRLPLWLLTATAMATASAAPKRITFRRVREAEDADKRGLSSERFGTFQPTHLLACLVPSRGNSKDLKEPGLAAANI